MSCDADDILVPRSTPAGLLEPRASVNAEREREHGDATEDAEAN
jgi:hypothetical protein